MIGIRDHSLLSLTRRQSRLFVLVFLLLAVAVASAAVWTAVRLHSDPEMKEQLEEVHDRASRREPPASDAP